MKLILAQLTSEHITAIIGIATLTVNLVLIPLVTFIISRQSKSEQTILKAGSEREDRLGKKMDVIETKADTNYEISNGHNEKISASVQLSREVLQKMEQKAELGSSETNPVHTITP